MANSLPNQWTGLIQQNLVHTTIGQWVGCFEVEEPDTHPVTIFQSSSLFCPIIGERSWAPFPPLTLKCFRVPVSTRIVDRDALVELDITNKAQWFRLVKICNVTKGAKKPSFEIHLGGDTLSMDLAKLHWKSGKDFLSYTSSISKNLLQERNPQTRSIITKWHGVILWSQVFGFFAPTRKPCENRLLDI